MASRTGTHCPHCGTRYQPHARKCAECGQARDPKSDAERLMSQRPQDDPSPKPFVQILKRIALATIGCIFLLVNAVNCLIQRPARRAAPPVALAPTPTPRTPAIRRPSGD